MTDDHLQIDFSLAMAQGSGRGGIEDSDLTAAAERFPAQLSSVLERVRAGTLGFWSLPDEPDNADAALALTQHFTHVSDVLLLGIGGSSLGARAVLHALSGAPAAAGLSPAQRRVHLPDNSDPWLLSALLSGLDPKKTLAVVVSKSGGTVETAAQLLLVREWLSGHIGESALSRHLVAITDPEHGSLRAFAHTHSLHTLPIPANVGGRFSVLTAAGLFPAALSGLDPHALLAGARAMARRCEKPALRENPAGLLATLACLQTERGRHIHVLMPYSDALRPLAHWYVQLWAESLGKRQDRQGRVVEVGPTPLSAVGATDQHAQVQLFMEGPRDKWVSFVSVAEPEHDLTIPPSEGDFSYLGGRTLFELLEAERRGTALALAQAERPSLTLKLPRLNEAHLGELLFLYEAATALAGEQLNVDAFDQPGVEAGKHLAFALLGRPGFEQKRQEIERFETTLPAYRV